MTAQLILIILSLFLLAGQSRAGETPAEKFDMPAISGVLNQTAEQAKTMSIPENPDAGSGQEAAEALMQQFQAPAYQAVIRAEQERLGQSVFHDVLAAFAPPAKPETPTGKLAADELVYLFFSSSVPLSTLRSYAAMLDKARDPNVVMVLRGFVGGMKKIKPTMEFIGNVLKKDPACETHAEQCDGYLVSIQIDPQLFQRYRIEQVPTVVYAAGQAIDNEAPEKQASHRDFVIAGDVSLDWLLEKINREAKSMTLAGLIGSLRNGSEGKQ